MGYCKLCECGTVLRFEKVYLCPDPCPVCGRMTQNYTTYREDDPYIISIVNGESEQENPVLDEAIQSGAGQKEYYLASVNGTYEIPIPAEGGIVGRTGIGAEQLSHNGAVSKQHLNVIRNKFGLFVEDISSFGTKVDGEEIIRGDRVLVQAGSHITLYNEELILKERDVQ